MKVNFQIKTMATNIVTNGLTQLKFTCSKSTIETLEKDMKYIQS